MAYQGRLLRRALRTKEGFLSRMRLGNWAVISSAAMLAVMAGVGLLVNIAGSNGAHARAKTVAGSGGSSRVGCTMPRAAFHSESDYRGACMVQNEGLVPTRLQSILVAVSPLFDPGGDRIRADVRRGTGASCRLARTREASRGSNMLPLS
ncbi:MAG: hypothetical protein ACYDEY_07745 [Acidimicrobiales bacterium]